MCFLDSPYSPSTHSVYNRHPKLVRGAVNSVRYELLKILGTEKKQACLDMPWVGRDNTYRILGKRSEPTDVTRAISKELDLPIFELVRIRSRSNRYPPRSLIGLRTIFCPLIPKTVALISSARKKKVHPAWRISRSNRGRSRSLMDLQPRPPLSGRSPFRCCLPLTSPSSSPRSCTRP